MTRLHRPYANKRGQPPSVTTVLGVLDKPGLPWAAARETALFAVNHPEELVGLLPAAAVDRLYRHHRGVWDHRAALGTLVHQVNEHWVHGEDVDLEAMVAEVQAKGKVWANLPTDTVIAEAGVMVDGLEAFWAAFTPDTISAEDVVRHPDQQNSYIGQNDWRVRMAGERWLLDLKTTGELDPAKGFYPDTWRLQLAAYRYAEEYVDYDDAGEETGTRKVEPVERCGIVHIRSDGSWALLPMQAGGTEHNRFLQLRGIWSWVNKESKTPPVEAHPAPVKEEAVA